MYVTEEIVHLRYKSQLVRTVLGNKSLFVLRIIQNPYVDVYPTVKIYSK